MIASSDVQLRKTPPSPSSKSSIRPFERPGSSKAKSSSRSRPSTGSSSKSYKSKDERRRGDITAHVTINLASLDSHRRERTPSNPSNPSAHRVLTRPKPPAHSQSASQDRGRPLAPSSSWSTLRFRTKSSSKESLKEDRNDVVPVPNNVGNSVGTSTIRRFQSLGFLRRKGSITVAQSPSSTSLASRSGGSSHGHSNSASNSSTGSQNHQQQHQQQPLGKPIQPPQTNHTHSVSAATVFPSLSRSSTFTLTVTTGSSSSSPNKPAVSFARPPKANPVSRKSISLYETSSIVKPSPSDSGTHARPTIGKRPIPLPATKTRVVARTPCTYDVTTVRPTRPRSSSLPLDPALQAAIASTSKSTSRSEDAHMRSSHISDAKDSQMIKAHGGRLTSPTRPLNTSTSLTDIFSSFNLAPMALRAPATSLTSTPRAHNRHAAVYRPPPPVDADGHAQADQPKPALSLSMPSGVSIINLLPPLSNTLLPPTSANHTGSAARGQSSRNASPASPYPPLFSSSPSSSSPLTSARPPPRAPVPESPGASPENRSKPLPTIPTMSGSFSAASSPTVTSPHRTKNSLSPWARQRAHSTARLPDTRTSITGEDKSSWAPALNYLTNPSALKTSPKPNRANIDGAKQAAQEKINYTSGTRLGTSNTRTIYATTPSIPISNQRRPSLPITPTTARFEYSQQVEDLSESLWGYFEQSGLTSSKQSRELWRSRSANALSEVTSQSGSNPTSSVHEANLTPPLSTTPRMRKGSGSGGVGVNMRKSVHSVYASPSPSGSSSHTPQTPNSTTLHTPPLTSSASPNSPYQRRPPPLSAAPRSNSTDTATTIKLSSKQTIILREPPSSRPARAARPTHLISQSLPSPKADSFNIIDTPAHEQVIFMNQPRSQRGMETYHSPTSFFHSPYPSAGVTFPVTPVTPMTPWMGSGKNGDADSLVLPPSPSPHYQRV